MSARPRGHDARLPAGGASRDPCGRPDLVRRRPGRGRAPGELLHAQPRAGGRRRPRHDRLPVHLDRRLRLPEGARRPDRARHGQPRGAPPRVARAGRVLLLQRIGRRDLSETISGYTGYLADVELDHAQDILADLIGAVVTALRPNFRLAKLEGDAAFTFATAETIDGSMLLDTIERCYFGFRRRRRDVRQATSCECNACARIPDLDLKFVVHHGAAIRQKVAGRQELLGSDVIVVHRLLKNEVVEKLGIDAYALISQAVHRCHPTSIRPRSACASTPRPTIASARCRPGSHDLERRWQEEEARGRVFVTPEESILDRVGADRACRRRWPGSSSPSPGSG